MEFIKSLTKTSITLYLTNFQKLFVIQLIILFFLFIPPHFFTELALTVQQQIELNNSNPNMSEIIMPNIGLTTFDFIWPILLLLISSIVLPYLFIKVYKIVLPTTPTTRITFKNFSFFIVLGLIVSLFSLALSQGIYFFIPQPTPYLQLIPSFLFFPLMLLIALHIAINTPGLLKPLTQSIKILLLFKKSVILFFMFALMLLISLLPFLLMLSFLLFNTITMIVVIFITTAFTPLIYTLLASYYLNLAHRL